MRSGTTIAIIRAIRDGGGFEGADAGRDRRFFNWIEGSNWSRENIGQEAACSQELF
jgi:hypothetical protein